MWAGPPACCGTVENPQSLLDEFALVAPGQVNGPTRVTALFDAHGPGAASIGPVRSCSVVTSTNP